jgi:hypothetical protein
VDILTKTIQFSITVLELREIYPDTNVFEVPESVDLDDDISYPVTVFPIKPEFQRMIVVIVGGDVKYYDVENLEENNEYETPELTKALKILSGAVPVVFDGYYYNGFYIISDLLMFGDFKRGKTRLTYDKRFGRLKDDIREYREAGDIKNKNLNIMFPVLKEVANREELDKFVAKKGKTYVIKSWTDNYEKLYQV